MGQWITMCQDIRSNKVEQVILACEVEIPFDLRYEWYFGILGVSRRISKKELKTQWLSRK